MTSKEQSARCLIGISTHIARAIAEVNMALALSLEEGSEHIEEKLCEVITDLDMAGQMNTNCGRVWEENENV